MPILLLDSPFVFTGLGTFTYTVPATRIYNVHVEATEIPPSGLTVVVNNNGSPIFTAPAVSPTQGAFQFKYSFNATAADPITVVISSAQAIDSVINNVKTTVTIGRGA